MWGEVSYEVLYRLQKTSFDKLIFFFFTFVKQEESLGPSLFYYFHSFVFGVMPGPCGDRQKNKEGLLTNKKPAALHICG